MIKGVIFDMDGVIVDSESIICKAAIKMFSEHGINTQPSDFIPFIGTGENRYLSGVAEKHGYPIDIERDKARTYVIYTEIIKGNLQPLPGVKNFIERCKNLSLKLALATSADEVKMIANFNEIKVPLDTFDATVNGLEVVKKKPDPEIFISAAKKLGLRCEDCLVVEDAVSGVKAAKASGAFCLALTTSFTIDELKDADWFAPTLQEAPEEAITW
jgi:beta-phosphoglucomutase